MGKGGLCVESIDEFEYQNPQTFRTTIRTVVQRSDGVWYPKESRSERRIGSRSAEPSGVSTLQIHSFEPLQEKTIVAPATLSVFGPLPKGAWITEIDESGKKYSYENGSTEEAGLEEQLLKQAESIRAKKKSEGGDK